MANTGSVTHWIRLEPVTRAGRIRARDLATVALVEEYASGCELWPSARRTRARTDARARAGARAGAREVGCQPVWIRVRVRGGTVSS